MRTSYDEDTERGVTAHLRALSARASERAPQAQALTDEQLADVKSAAWARGKSFAAESSARGLTPRQRAASVLLDTTLRNVFRTDTDDRFELDALMNAAGAEHARRALPQPR